MIIFVQRNVAIVKLKRGKEKRRKVQIIRLIEINEINDNQNTVIKVVIHIIYCRLRFMTLDLKQYT